MAITFIAVDFDNQPLGLDNVEKVYELLTLVSGLENKNISGRSQRYNCPEHGIEGVNFEIMRIESLEYDLPFVTVIWNTAKYSPEELAARHAEFVVKQDHVLDWLAYRMGPPYFTALKRFRADNGYGTVEAYGDFRLFYDKVFKSLRSKMALVTVTPGA